MLCYNVISALVNGCVEQGYSELTFVRGWKIVVIVVVQLFSHVRLCKTIAYQAPPSSTISQSLLKFMSIDSAMLAGT